MKVWRVVTLTQPWATLCVLGLKKFETRSWATAYRGPLAIHAAKGFPRWAKDLCADPLFAAALKVGGYHSWADLPTAAVVGTVNLDGCYKMTGTGHYYTPDLQVYEVPYAEQRFGDWNAGRYAWKLSSPRTCSPVPLVGQLGLYVRELPLTA